jgi:uncharacterized protein YbaR (Trm112 family)
MKQSLLSRLACPFDKADLSIKIFQENQEEILEGILTCTHCQRYYPIIYGIPVMSPDEYRELSLEMPLIEKWGERLLAENASSAFQLMSRDKLDA